MNWLRRHQPDPWEPQERFNGLSEAELNTLGAYNAERGRGIVHDPEWQGQMAALQARFNAAERERYVNHIVDAYVYGRRSR